MEPTVPDGSLVLMDCTRRNLRNGRIFVVRIEDGFVVRRASENVRGDRELVSDHPNWPDATSPDDVEVIGEVRWVATLLD